MDKTHEKTFVGPLVTRDQVERIVCAILQSVSLKLDSIDGYAPALVATAMRLAEEINRRNFAPALQEQMFTEYLRDIFEMRKGREQFAEHMSQAAAMAEKEIRGKSDG